MTNGCLITSKLLHEPVLTGSLYDSPVIVVSNPKLNAMGGETHGQTKDLHSSMSQVTQRQMRA
jgi:hypothetical protein